MLAIYNLCSILATEYDVSTRIQFMYILLVSNFDLGISFM